MTLIIFLFFLGLLIFVHELGHFLIARRTGAIVEEFSLGFPPRIFSKKIKDTTYSIGIILFGGFVKLKGEDDPNDTSGFLYLSPLKKLLIVLAGVIFNIFLAYFLFVLSLSFGYPHPSEKIFIMGFLDKNSPITQKFQVGDEILALRIEDKEYKFKNLDEFSKFLKLHYNKEVEYVISRNGEILIEKVVIPAGIYLGNFILEKEKFPRSLLIAVNKTYENFEKIFTGFYQLILSIFSKEKVNLEIVGPVGIYNLFDNFKNFGWGYIFYFIAVISLNLAFINILPFPALDGGRILFIIIELITKKFDYKKEEIIHKIGFLFLFILLIIVTFKDIYKIWFK